MADKTHFSRVVGFALALMCVAAAAVALTMLGLRRDALNEATTDAGNIATVLARQTSNSAQSIDLVLDETLARIATFDPRTPEEFAAVARKPELSEFLAARLARLRQAEAINLADQSGQLRLSTRSVPPPDMNVSDRDGFQHLSQSRDTAMFVGAPGSSRLTGQRTMYFYRRIESREGVFLGVALVAARPETILPVYDVLEGLPGMSATLLDPNGNDYFHPRAQDEASRDAQPDRRASGSLVAARAVERYPLIVAVDVSEDSALAVWRQRAGVIAGGGVAAALVFALLLGMLHTAYRKSIASKALLSEREARLREKSRELKRVNLRFDRVFTQMRLGLAMFDADERIVIHNRGYADIYGVASEGMPPGTKFETILRLQVASGAYSPEGSEASLWRHREHRGEEFSDIEHLRDGRHVFVAHQPLPEGGWITTHEDVTERQRAVARISHMAHHDGLTNLANRTLFLEKVAAISRRPCVRYAVMLLDLDQFKAVNDTYGHDAGDALLWAVAARMQQVASNAEIVARLGGDEFAIAIVLGPNEDEDTLGLLADRLIAEIREPFPIDDCELRIGSSIGMAMGRGEASEASEIMRFADMALYRAKAEGRNCHRMFESAMEDDIRLRRRLALDLEAALATGTLEVHYQPVVDTISRLARGMEALARWRHPSRGFVSPADFIPIAEEAGLIQRLGEFVLRRACADAVGWPADVMVAVNVSPIQIAASGFVDRVRAALRDAGLPASRLELEITESVLLDDSASNLGVLHELRAEGVSIVLDDFGTGFSSLSYLNRFPFNKIKIDKSFIDGLGVHAGSDAIVSATTSIARALNASTTAEGVETESQSNLLLAAAVTQLQGYLYGKPRPASEWVFEDGRAYARAPNPASAAA